MGQTEKCIFERKKDNFYRKTRSLSFHIIFFTANTFLTSTLFEYELEFRKILETEISSEIAKITLKSAKIPYSAVSHTPQKYKAPHPNTGIHVCFNVDWFRAVYSLLSFQLRSPRRVKSKWFVKSRQNHYTIETIQKVEQPEKQSGGVRFFLFTRVPCLRACSTANMVLTIFWESSLRAVYIFLWRILNSWWSSVKKNDREGCNKLLFELFN